MTFKEIKQRFLSLKSPEELSLAESIAFGGEVRDMLDHFWQSLISPEERNWFKACHDCVQKGDSVTLDEWITKEKPKEELKDYLGSNYDNYDGEKLYNAFRAHLLCVKAVIKHGHWTNHNMTENKRKEILCSIAEDTHLPIGFLHDLIQELMTGNIRPAIGEQSLIALLVEIDLSGKKGDGVIANLKLELISGGDGSIYPVPALALLPRDSNFRDSEKNACECVKGLLRNDCDIRWRLERRDKEPLSPALVGGSAGGDFTLGMAKLLADNC